MIYKKSFREDSFVYVLDGIVHIFSLDALTPLIMGRWLLMNDGIDVLYTAAKLLSFHQPTIKAEEVLSNRILIFESF